MSNPFIVSTHEDQESIPKGMAVLCMGNNGFVGTNNGYRFFGQPALFPESQAHALATAWFAADLYFHEHPEVLERTDPETAKWFTTNLVVHGETNNGNV